MQEEGVLVHVRGRLEHESKSTYLDTVGFIDGHPLLWRGLGCLIVDAIWCGDTLEEEEDGNPRRVSQSQLDQLAAQIHAKIDLETGK